MNDSTAATTCANCGKDCVGTRFWSEDRWICGECWTNWQAAFLKNKPDALGMLGHEPRIAALEERVKELEKQMALRLFG